MRHEMKYRDELTTIRDMSRLYSIYDFLHINSRKKVIVCPLPQHPHKQFSPSFSIFTTHDGIQKWHCFGASCGHYGDVIDLAGFIHIPGYRKDNGEDVKRALAILSGRTQINPPKPEPAKQATLSNGLYKLYLPAGDAVRKYAQEKRFLTSETLERFHIGQNCTGLKTWMTIPTIHGDELRGIKLRNLNAAGKKDRYSNEPGSIGGLFNYNGVYNTTRPVLIVKGEIAVMVLAQHGILACAPIGGEGSYFKHEELLMPLAFSDKRVVVGDNDSDPQVHEKMMAAAKRRAEIFKAEMRLPPDPYVGIDDWVIAEPCLAIPAIKSWME